MKSYMMKILTRVMMSVWEGSSTDDLDDLDDSVNGDGR